MQNLQDIIDDLDAMPAEAGKAYSIKMARRLGLSADDIQKYICPEPTSDADHTSKGSA